MVSEENVAMTIDIPEMTAELYQMARENVSSPATSSDTPFKQEENLSQPLGPYLAFGKFKADSPIDGKVEEVISNFDGVKCESDIVTLILKQSPESKHNQPIKTDEIKDIKLDPKIQDGDTKDEEKDSIILDHKPSMSPPPLTFGKFKRGSTEPQTIMKSEVIGQDVANILIDYPEDPSTVEEAGPPDNGNAVGIDADPFVDPSVEVRESLVGGDRAERLVSIPPLTHEDLEGIPHDENNDIVPSLVEDPEDTAQTPRDSPDDSERRPVKRQRLIFEAIELQTVELVYGKKVRRRVADSPVIIEELNEKMEKMKNPKVKKLQGFGLSLDTVRDRLLAVGLDPYPIVLEKEIQDVMVKRLFISSLYGGDTQSTLPSIGKRFLQSHGLNDFMYPNLNLNPHAPEMPGSPGLFFGANGSHAGPWGTGQGIPERVITRIRPGIWQYQGQYVLAPTRSLTKEEWQAQSSKVQSTWAKQIMKKDWGRTVRCRVSLRKRLGRPFTAEEFEEAIEKRLSYQDGIDRDDILQALLRGDEFIAVWTMKCVGYDVDFQRNLAEKYPTWIPPPKIKKGQGSKGRRGNGKKRATAAARKRKVRTTESDLEGSDDPDVGSGSDDGDIERNLKRSTLRKKSPATQTKASELQSHKRERSAAQVGKKRKREVIEIDDTDEDEDETDEDEDEDEFEELVYQSRGTKSRPIRILE